MVSEERAPEREREREREVEEIELRKLLHQTMFHTGELSCLLEIVFSK